MTADPEDRIVVRDQPAHGVPAEEYVDELRERLPDWEVELASTPTEERALVPGARVVAGFDLEEDLLERADALELFACGSAGVGHLDLDDFRERGIAVTNGSGVHGSNIAEQVLGWLLGFARRLDEGWRREQRREWRHFQADDFQGSTVTVVGLGAIGEAVVERLAGFGVHTVGARYTPEKGGPTDEVVGFRDREAFHDALARTDYLVLATPLTDETEGLIGREELLTLPTDAVVVNVGRGPVVDTGALVSAIRGNKLEGAALDVTDPEPLPEDHPLWTFENVRITPHNAGHTPQYFARLAEILAENLERIEETGRRDDLRNQVAVPEES